MSTQVVQYNPQLPAFLRVESLFADTDKAIAGIGGGMPAYISIRGAKWHLVGADGEEAQVNQLHLDVIVLGGNEHVSKSYYSGPYDPAQGGGSPPDCFSDNGVAPSSQAMTPQHATCAGCAHAAWGSKITPTGSHVKACSDSKKLAVVLAADTPILVNGAASVAKAYAEVYLLRVPAASMRNWRDYAKDIRGRGVPIIGVVARMTFDPQASYPALLFQAVGFVPNESVFQQLMTLKDQPGTAEAIGANDRPLLAASNATGTTGQSPLAPVAAAAPAPTPPAAPLPVAAPSAPAATDTSGTRRRGRPPTAIQAAPAPQMFPAPAPVSPSPPQSMFGGIQGNGAIQVAAAAPADLDALLKQALG